jgi:hypothetical protein
MYGATWVRGVDLVAVERATSLCGVCPQLTPEEQRYAAQRMTAAERSASEIAGRLGIAERTVTRWRDEDRGPA